MKKSLIPLVAIAISLSSCYNYEGPTRFHKKITPPTPREIVVKKPMSAQEYLNKMAGDIERKVPSAQVTILQDSIKVLFPDNIKYSKSSILPVMEINSEMKKLASLIRQYEKTNIIIAGHTDKSGNEKGNKQISQMRAQYIMDLLVAHKAPKDRIGAWGLGSSSPISSANVPGGNDNNRRVEFVILANMEEVAEG